MKLLIILLISTVTANAQIGLQAGYIDTKGFDGNNLYFAATAKKIGRPGLGGQFAYRKVFSHDLQLTSLELTAVYGPENWHVHLGLSYLNPSATLVTGVQYLIDLKQVYLTTDLTYLYGKGVMAGIGISFNP